MSEQPAVPEGLQVAQTRVYYDPGSGRVVHVHQLVTSPDAELDPQRIEEEMTAFEEVVRARHGDVGSLVVEAADLPAADEAVTVDVPGQRLVRRSSPGQERA
jgi:hypothetical protein